MSKQTKRQVKWILFSDMRLCVSSFEYLVFCFLFSFLVHPVHFLQIGKKYLPDVMNHLFSLQNETRVRAAGSKFSSEKEATK